MKGQVISYFPQHNQGFIMGEDGNKYSFMDSNWQVAEPPKEGDHVEFLVDDTGKVIEISVTPTPFNNQIPSNNQINSQAHQGQTAENYGQTPPSLDKVYAAPTSNLASQNNFSSAQEALYAEEESYNMIDWTKKCLQNYVKFDGRARRKEYWYFYLTQILISFALGIVFGMIAAATGTDLSWVINIISLAFFLPTIAAGARRLHDTDRSGWLQLLWLIPILGWIPLIIWLASDTKPESNRWGAPAKQFY